MGENECNKETAFYKEKITEMVVKCDNERFLKFLYNTILSFKKKWGINRGAIRKHEKTQ